MKLDRVIAVRNNKTVFRDGNRCVKIFSSAFSKADVFSEALNHARVEAVADFVPKLLEVIRHDQNWAIVYEFVKGNTLSQGIEQAPNALEEHAQLFARLHQSIHRLSCPALDSQKERFRSGIENAPLTARCKQRLLRGLDRMKFSHALCHCDFVPSNVILPSEGAPFVIDWGSALCGEPLADAAITYILLIIRGREAFAEAYRRIYSKITGKTQEEMEHWFPYAAAYLMSFANQAQREALIPYVKSVENEGE